MSRNGLAKVASDSNHRGRESHVLPPLTEDERETILVRWNATERELPPDSHIVRLFEQQAERTPHSPAASAAGQQVSFHAQALGPSRSSVSSANEESSRSSQFSGSSRRAAPTYLSIRLTPSRESGR
jgi:hypothetical protein